MIMMMMKIDDDDNYDDSFCEKREIGLEFPYSAHGSCALESKSINCARKENFYLFTNLVNKTLYKVPCSLYCRLSAGFQLSKGQAAC